MSTEYERRFLVPDSAAVIRGNGSVIVQGYLYVRDGWCIRVRRRHDPQPDGRYSEAIPTLALKGPRKAGARSEYEMSIDIQTAAALLRQTEWTIVKTRHQVVDAGQVFDVDVFHHPTAQLVIAECEFMHGLGDFTPPAWCGREVTFDARYNNDVIATNKGLISDTPQGDPGELDRPET